MTDEPQYERTTTTPLRAQRSNRPPGVNRLPNVSVVAVSAVLLVIALHALSASGSSLPVATLLSQVATTTPVPPTQSTPAPAAVCPYCGQDPDYWMKQTTTAPPRLSGQTAAVVEGACGRLIYGLRQNERLPPASLTKIVTALVVAEQARLTDRVDIKVTGWELVVKDGSSVMGLEAGMNLSVEELLYGLLLPSGNDAALALADHLGGRRFVDLMNQRVKKSGLTNTYFGNPDGRDGAGNYTSALDSALLGRELMSNPALRRIDGTQTIKATWDGHLMWNDNYLVYGYPGAIGVKMGYTELAKETMVGAAARDGRELYVAILASDFAYLDTVSLLDWAFANTRPAC